MIRTIADTIEAARRAPKLRFLTTPAGRLNYRNAFGYARCQLRLIRRNLPDASFRVHLAELRSGAIWRIAGERDAHSANPMQAAADRVDAKIAALDILFDTCEREYAILAEHEGRPAIACNAAPSFGSSMLTTRVNLGEPDALDFARAYGRSLEDHVGLNAAGEAFLAEARATAIKAHPTVLSALRNELMLAAAE